MPALQIEDSVVLQVARQLAPNGGGSATSGPAAERLLTEQPEVLAFILAGTAQLRSEARPVAVFLGDVVVECFRRAGRASRAVAPAEFVQALRRNREMALRVGQAHDRFAERYLRNSNTLHQPALIRFVTGVLLEPDDSCPHELPREDLGPLFIVLKSVIDVLDDDWTALQGAGAGLSPEPS